ncbi:MULTISPECIES: tyrosine-protein phosphatase [Comamonas]|jgi:protein-tyrosine phosphatase|uniref:Tyrosine-protein phosphatase n=1 Tax=Comamonas aquatica TaxID=225991 RepID=A0AA42HSG2_9BURK|nr:tyrosine-protein phosphatase [Comamonas aquatica]MDE1556501.1 tyrosine-protein phosphatase [Comamonas aquatica]MDH0362106.1 tyrosine-protein phosphatase [Comamonas aquatica]MDH1767689.1 tyrosine-protein phosphatase [Comamonas aquatica]
MELAPLTPVSLPRSIALDGTTNFRDLGGYAGADGRTVRWRKLFRSDHLAGLSPADLQALQALGVARAVDFRGVQERACQGYAWPFLEQQVLGIEPTVVQRALALVQQGHRLTADETVGLMQDTYRSFVIDNADRFARLFRLLQDSDQPLVFHCTAGKDRTGWAAALILLALGVSREAVREDYLLTNQLYRRPAELAAKAAQSVPQDILDVLWRVQMPFLDSAFVLAEQHAGSMDRYLAEVLGVDAAARQRLAQRYLEG